MNERIALKIIMMILGCMFFVLGVISKRHRNFALFITLSMLSFVTSILA